MSDNVIPFKAKIKEVEEVTETKAEMSFEEVQEYNRKNEERLRKERLQANKSVLRSYRIKH